MNDPTKASSADTGPDGKMSADDAAQDVHIESPHLAPDQDAAKEAPRREGAPAMTGKLMIMAPSRKGAGERNWDDIKIDSETSADHPAAPDAKTGGRRLSAFAVVVALAAVAGAIGGAMATAGVSHFSGGSEQASAADHLRTQDDTIMRIEADLAALKSNVDRTAKTNLAQFGKANDRFDKVEKAQAEPAAKLAKLSETVEKMRTAATTPAPAPAPVAAAPAREVTGSIPPAAASPPPKPDVARLPTVEGWVLRDVGNGSAVIEGRAGIFEVYAGDPVPGLGRIDAIRRQDGRWVVVTSKGLIVAR